MKIFLGIAVAISLILQPLPATAEGESLIFGKFVDLDGSPIGQVPFSFTFADGSYASGTTKADGTFLLSGQMGAYRFNISSDYGQAETCMKTNFKGNFDSQREEFTLVFPRKATYVLEVVDSKARVAFGATWMIRNTKFTTPQNPEFGDPEFTCAYLYGTLTSPTKPSSAIKSFEIDWLAMQEGGPGYATPFQRVSYLDSVIGNNIMQPGFSDFAGKQRFVLVASKLPTIEIGPSTFAQKSGKLAIAATLIEPTHLQGANVPRKVKVMWRYKPPRTGTSWSSWKYGPETLAKVDGKISSAFKLPPNNALQMKPGTKVEYRVIGVDFGSMSELKAFTTR